MQFLDWASAVVHSEYCLHTVCQGGCLGSSSSCLSLKARATPGYFFLAGLLGKDCVIMSHDSCPPVLCCAVSCPVLCHSFTDADDALELARRAEQDMRQRLNMTCGIQVGS